MSTKTINNVEQKKLTVTVSAEKSKISHLELIFEKMFDKFDELNANINNRMDKLEKRMTVVEEYIKSADERIESLDEKFDLLDENVINIDTVINDKFGEITKSFLNIESKINSGGKTNENSPTQNLKELKTESITTIEKKDILKALSYRDYRSIITLFRLHYKNKTEGESVYPIKIKSVRSFEFYDMKKWNPDLYGHHSMNVICMNFQDLFIKYNNLDSNDISHEDLFLNQMYILKLSDEKYKKEIFKHIIEEVRINS